jgi:SAM-dependent methyltransferase
MLALRPGQTIVDLGCGDGQIARLAAERGWRVIGYEINPILALIARLRCRRYQGRVKIYWRSFWSGRLPACDGVFVFGIERIMPRLSQKLSAELKGGTRVVSYAFRLPGRKASRQRGALFLYEF